MQASAASSHVCGSQCNYVSNLMLSGVCQAEGRYQRIVLLSSVTGQAFFFKLDEVVVVVVGKQPTGSSRAAVAPEMVESRRNAPRDVAVWEWQHSGQLKPL